jgi:hypothetical protein
VICARPRWKSGSLQPKHTTIISHLRRNPSFHLRNTPYCDGKKLRAPFHYLAWVTISVDHSFARPITWCFPFLFCFRFSSLFSQLLALVVEEQPGLLATSEGERYRA